LLRYSSDIEGQAQDNLAIKHSVQLKARSIKAINYAKLNRFKNRNVLLASGLASRI